MRQITSTTADILNLIRNTEIIILMIRYLNFRRKAERREESCKEAGEETAMAAAEIRLRGSSDLLLARDSEREHEEAGIIVEITLARSMGS